MASPQTEVSINDLETIIAANDDMINHLLVYFPSEEDREQIIAAVKEKTGFEITEEFFDGEASLAIDIIGVTRLDS